MVVDKKKKPVVSNSLPINIFITKQRGLDKDDVEENYHQRFSRRLETKVLIEVDSFAFFSRDTKLSQNFPRVLNALLSHTR